MMASDALAAHELLSPKDATTYGAFLLLGAGILLPWNAFITAADYFELRYPGRHADRMFSICYLPTQLITLLGVVRFHNELSGLTILRVLSGFCGFTAVMLLLTLLEVVTASSSTFAAVLALVIATGFLDGIAQGALYGEASLLPPAYTQAIVLGTAVSGTLVSALRIATKAAFADSPEGIRFGAYLFFLLAAAVCLCCSVVYGAVLPRQPLVQKARLQKQAHGQRMDLAESGLQPSSSADEVGGRNLPQSSRLLGEGIGGLESASLKTTLKTTLGFTLSLVVIYTVTLAIFPGVLVEDVSSAQLGSWYPVLLIAAFNVADLVGKSLPRQGPFGRDSGRLTLTCSLLRFLFVPAFYGAARGGAPLTVPLTLALGLSNGFLTSSALVGAPLRVQGRNEKQLVGNLTILALVGGLAIGAACSFLWLL